MKARLAGLAMAAALGLALVPASAPASHCADILVFTGYTDQIPPNQVTSGMLNPGAAGCTNAAAHADTNLIMPGATFVIVGGVGTNAQPATNGAIKFNNGNFQSFTFTHNGTRWVSPRLAIPAGTTTITARGTTTNTGAPKTETVTYRVAP